MLTFVPSRVLVIDIIKSLRQGNNGIMPSPDDIERISIVVDFMSFGFASVIAMRAVEKKKFYVVKDLRFATDMRVGIASIFNVPVIGPGADLLVRIAQEFHKWASVDGVITKPGPIERFEVVGDDVICHPRI